MGEWMQFGTDHIHDMPESLSLAIQVGAIWRCKCGRDFQIQELFVVREWKKDLSDYQLAIWDKL